MSNADLRIDTHPQKPAHISIFPSPRVLGEGVRAAHVSPILSRTRIAILTVTDNQDFMRIFIIAISIGLLTTAAFADQQWTLTTADFQSRPVSLRGLDDQGLRVGSGAADAEQIIPLEEFLQLDRSTTAEGQSGPFIIYSADGDRMSGSPVAIQQEQLKWLSPAVGELTLPLRNLAAIARADYIVNNIGEQRAEDIVTLANGDVLRGIVTGIAADAVTVQMQGDPLTAPMESVVAIHFATAAHAAPTTDRAYRIRLADGSTLSAARVELVGEQFQLTLADQSRRAVALSMVSGIEQINGPVKWLSSALPVENVQIPHLGLSWPAKMDRSVAGEPIRFGEQIFSRGIGVHAYSRMVFALDGQYKTFRTQYAIDASETGGQYADVTVRIKLDDQIVHEQENFHAATLAQPVVIELGTAKTLTLEVDYGQANDTQDRFNWIEPALVRGE